MIKDYIEKVYNFLKLEFEGVCTAHDLQHIIRVYNLSKKIYVEEKQGDEIVIYISALLHEMLDKKFFGDKYILQKTKVLDLLKTLGLCDIQIEKIIYILENFGYGISLTGNVIDKSIEFKIVEDADRLESVGAIAIARTFAYGGKKNRAIYDPLIEVELNMTEDKYNSANGTSINHFYEKLLLVKDLMNTKSGKKLSLERHSFVEKFLEQFFCEIGLK
ncbi:MAG: phosphohydrolase [Candidatus Gracilibacteria bacterium]|nr:phosphohydrolase [Candidatus Gracilibacteria bacterium]